MAYTWTFWIYPDLPSFPLILLHNALWWFTGHKVIALYPFNIIQGLTISFWLDSLGYDP